MTQYKDVSGNPCTLRELVTMDPEWAASRLRILEPTAKAQAVAFQALEHYNIETGNYDCQVDMCIEECAELTKALLKHRRGVAGDTGLLEPGEWYALAGTDLESTRNCARATLRIVQRFARWCNYDMARMHAAYGTGQGCVIRQWAVDRARVARGIERDIG